eukprot:Awhi_evm1s8383
MSDDHQTMILTHSSVRDRRTRQEYPILPLGISGCGRQPHDVLERHINILTLLEFALIV